MLALWWVWKCTHSETNNIFWQAELQSECGSGLDAIFDYLQRPTAKCAMEEFAANRHLSMVLGCELNKIRIRQKLQKNIILKWFPIKSRDCKKRLFFFWFAGYSLANFWCYLCLQLYFFFWYIFCVLVANKIIIRLRMDERQWNSKKTKTNKNILFFLIFLEISNNNNNNKMYTVQ